MQKYNQEEIAEIAELHGLVPDTTSGAETDAELLASLKDEFGDNPEVLAFIAKANLGG